MAKHNSQPTPLADTTSAERIGNAALNALDTLRENSDYADGSLQLVMVITVVSYTDADGDPGTSVDYWCEDDRRYIQVGVLRGAQITAEGMD